MNYCRSVGLADTGMSCTWPFSNTEVTHAQFPPNHFDYLICPTTSFIFQIFKSHSWLLAAPRFPSLAFELHQRSLSLTLVLSFSCLAAKAPCFLRQLRNPSYSTFWAVPVPYLSRSKLHSGEIHISHLLFLYTNCIHILVFWSYLLRFFFPGWIDVGWLDSGWKSCIWCWIGGGVFASRERCCISEILRYLWSFGVVWWILAELASVWLLRKLGGRKGK